MSRQTDYMARNQAAGLCAYCPSASVLVGQCAYHALRHRGYRRRRLGLGRWTPGGVGRPPRFTDAELRAIATLERAGAS